MHSILIAAVGDISLGDHYFQIGRGPRHVVETEGTEFLFANIRETLQRSDLAFGNLETVLSDTGFDIRDIHSQVFRGSPIMAAEMRRSGFGVLNIANNHILQHGPTPFSETLQGLRNAGIAPLGLAQMGDGLSSIPVELEIRGRRVCFVGYSFITERYCTAQAHYAPGDVRRICSDIQALRNKTDILIVSCHWGVEGMSHPSPAAANVARTLIDAGADIILGHHPHVTQAVERYRKGLICYSLGNFVFDLEWSHCLQRGAVIEIQIGVDGDTEYRFVPYEINRQFQPTPLEGETRQRYLRSLDQLQVPSVRGDFDQACQQYYTDVSRVEKSLAWKRHTFFWANCLRGDKRAKAQFLREKIANRLGGFSRSLKRRA